MRNHKLSLSLATLMAIVVLGSFGAWAFTDYPNGGQRFRAAVVFEKSVQFLGLSTPLTLQVASDAGVVGNLGVAGNVTVTGNEAVNTNLTVTMDAGVLGNLTVNALLNVLGSTNVVAVTGTGKLDERSTAFFDGGIAIGNTSGTAANYITRVLFGSEVMDFASTTTTCNDSTGATVTGAIAGDSCFLGIPSTAPSANATYSCYVSAANTVKTRHCAAGTADDPASATYKYTIVSFQ